MKNVFVTLSIVLLFNSAYAIDLTWVDQTASGEKFTDVMANEIKAAVNSKSDEAFTPSGNISSTTVHQVLLELDAKKQPVATLNSAISANSDVQSNLAKISFDSSTSARLAGTSGPNTGDAVAAADNEITTGTSTVPKLFTPKQIHDEGGGSGATNLSNTPSATNVVIESSSGTNTPIPAATTILAGVMVAEDKIKLEGVAPGAQVNPAMDSTPTTGHTISTVSSHGTYIALALKASISDVLLRTNTTIFMPTLDYHPATKKYIDDAFGNKTFNMNFLNAALLWGTGTNYTDHLYSIALGTKDMAWTIYDRTVDIAVGDGEQAFVIPSSYAGYDLVGATCGVRDLNGATSGATTMMLSRVRGNVAVNMMSTGVTISYNEYSASDAVIDTANDDLQIGDNLYWNIITGTTAVQKGLSCSAVFRYTP